VAGSGDWRANGLVRAGHEVNHPLRSSQASPREGSPAPARYLGVDGAEVVVSAVKASGNPIAHGRAVGPVDGLTVRLIEPHGRAQQATLTTAFPAGEVRELDLVERDRGGVSGAVALGPMQIGTVRLGVAADAGDAVLIGERDPHQPTYARYWLDNTGPAPIGGMPVTVHAEPSVVERAEGASDPIEVTVTVSSDRTDETVDTEVELIVPPGWSAEPARVPVSLPPGGYTQTTVRVQPAADTAPGIWWVRSRIETGSQAVEDITRVLVGANAAREVEVELVGPDPLTPGADDRLVVAVTNHARSAVSGRVQLISPWHTWELVDTWDTGVTVEPGETARVSFAVHARAGVEDGSWWALAKVAVAGSLHYTEPVELTVRS